MINIDYIINKYRNDLDYIIAEGLTEKEHISITIQIIAKCQKKQEII